MAQLEIETIELTIEVPGMESLAFVTVSAFHGLGVWYIDSIEFETVGISGMTTKAIIKFMDSYTED